MQESSSEVGNLVAFVTSLRQRSITISSHFISSWKRPDFRFLVETPTEERRLVEEEGSISMKTWLQKKQDEEGVGELHAWAQHTSV